MPDPASRRPGRRPSRRPTWPAAARPSGPRHLARLPVGACHGGRARRRTRRSPPPHRPAAAPAAAVAGRRSAASWPCCRRPTRSAKPAPTGARAGRAPPPAAAAAGRDREAHQRRERAAQEALHQPGHARGGVCAVLRRPAPAHRGARHARLSRGQRPQALRRADDERHRRRRRPRRRGRDRAPFQIALLDQRAVAIVHAASPFGPFSPAMRAQADQIVVTSRFRFTRDEGLETQPDDAEPATEPSPPDRYAVLGNPVAHSRRPSSMPSSRARPGSIWTTAACCARWAALPAARARVRRRRPDGAGRAGDGCNVTVPFKFEALRRWPRAAARAPRWPGRQRAALRRRGLVRRQHRRHRPGARHRSPCRRAAGRPARAAGGCRRRGAGVLGPLLQAAAVGAGRRQPHARKAQALVERHAALAAASGVILSAWPGRRWRGLRYGDQQPAPAAWQGARCRCRRRC
jgi:hypothetical protein